MEGQPEHLPVCFQRKGRQGFQVGGPGLGIELISGPKTDHQGTLLPSPLLRFQGPNGIRGHQTFHSPFGGKGSGSLISPADHSS